MILVAAKQTKSIDLEQFFNPGFSSPEVLLPDSSYTEKSYPMNFSFYWRVLALAYIIISIGILKIKYVYPTLEDICAIYMEKKMYFTRAMMFHFYNHVEVFFLLIFSIFYNSGQIGIFTLFGGEYFNYTIFIGLIMVISRKRQDLSKCLSLRGFFFALLALGNYTLYVKNGQTFGYVCLTWTLRIVYAIVDINNEFFLTLMFKMVCLIEEDEDFDTEPLEYMRRRRFSSDFFVDSVEEIKEKKELIHAIKKQDYVYSITYKDQKKIKSHKRFSKIVLTVIYCIREKVEEARRVRDEEFERRAGALENENDRSLPISDSSDDESDEMSLDKF